MAARAVLEERARALARPVAPPPPSGALQAVTFRLAEERYAIESRYVIEVLRLPALALLPGANSPAIGVTAWRGTPLAILDLRPLVGLSTAAAHDPGHVMVLGESRAAFGILADAVDEVRTLDASDVREPPEGVAPKPYYLLGVTGDAMLVLDAGKLLRGLA